MKNPNGLVVPAGQRTLSVFGELQGIQVIGWYLSGLEENGWYRGINFRPIHGDAVYGIFLRPAVIFHNRQETKGKLRNGG